MTASSHDRQRQPGTAPAAVVPLVAAAVLLTGICLAQPASEQPASEQPTSVPPALFVGAQIYFDHCASCHGLDATGTRFAPDLLDRVAAMDRATFETVLESGYPGVVNGPAPWAGIADVDRYADELWAYLDARADGTIGPGELSPAR